MQKSSNNNKIPADANNVLVAGVPHHPDYWVNEIRTELYQRNKPKKSALRLIKYYRQELKASMAYYDYR